MKEARRYARLFGVFVRTCFVKELEFRGNFWAGLFTNLIWVLSYLVFMKVIYANTQSVGGWSQGQAVMLLGTYAITRGLVDVLFSRNLVELPTLIRLGNFDFTLLKPVNSQFFVSLRYMNFTEIGTTFAAVAMVAYGAALAHVHITAVHVAQYVVLVMCGLTIFYAIYLMLMSTAFWFVKVENLWTLGESAFQVARVPMNVFGPTAVRIFTFVIPLIFVAHVPAQALMSAASPAMTGLSLGMAVALAFISSRFWRYATRFYSSASS